MLQIPLQVVTWILRDRYITGDEFTMNGQRVRLERIVCPETDRKDADPSEDDPDEAPAENGARVISLKDKRKR
jgi:hypothetical protein